MKSHPRCVSITKDGSQCGRRVKDGSNPPVCHVHKPGAQTPTQFQPTKRTPRERLERIANNDKHPQQLQALKLLLEETSCPKCAEREVTDGHLEDIIARATDAQRQEFTSLIATILTQPKRDPDAVPAHVLDRWAAEDEVTTPAAQPAPMPTVEPEETSDAEETDTAQIIEIEEADGSITELEIEEVDE